MAVQDLPNARLVFERHRQVIVTLARLERQTSWPLLFDIEVVRKGWDASVQDTGRDQLSALIGRLRQEPGRALPSEPRTG